MKRGDLSKGLPPDGHSGGASRSRSDIRNSTAIPETDLLDAALLGGIEEFAQLYEHYRPDLYKLCLRHLGEVSLAEDAVQEIFIKAFKNLSKFDRKKLFWPWLATVAFRICIDFQRQDLRTHSSPSEDIGQVVDDEVKSQPETFIDALIQREQLQEALKDLPKRQRRALLLYALDGWSYRDIASAEGISVGAVKLLLLRARKKMRAVYKGRAFGFLATPFSWRRQKTLSAQERIQVILTASGEKLNGAGAMAVSFAVLAVIGSAVNSPVEHFNERDEIGSIETLPAAIEFQATLENRHVAQPTRPQVESKEPVTWSAESLADDVINPNQNATPENTALGSITTSPNYESDHTILAAGYNPNYVLFVSQDGGGSWKPKHSRLLSGATVALPPRFPQDGRIFAIGGLGLQQSDDGGEAFRTVSPLSGFGLAISPSFGMEDSRILMGGKTLFEYDAATGMTRPYLAAVPHATGEYRSVAFSPSYKLDSTIFAAHEDRTSYRCQRSVCEVVNLPQPGGPLRLRFSPRFGQDGVAYAFTPWKLLVSKDWARTFEEVQFPFEVQFPLLYAGFIYDLAIAWNASPSPAIFVSVFEDSTLSRYPPGIYRSLDAEGSWSRTLIDIPGFGYAAYKLIITPTGRLLATGIVKGIACSVDFGENWAPRCPPEP